MVKRYQVFVSSTYTDLVEERRVVFQTLLEMGCFPAGMEFFLATDEEQLSFIKRVIDASDYYVLITGGRYGSMSESGISFTEQEFDYAVSIGMRVLVFTHKDIDSLPVGKSDVQPDVRAKLHLFLTKVQTNRLVQSWSSADDLAGKISRSLNKAIAEHPAEGWVRGNAVVSADALSDLNRVRNLNEQLQKANALLSQKLIAEKPMAQDLQGLNDSFAYMVLVPGGMYPRREITTTWGKIFGRIAPFLSEPLPESAALHRIKVAMEGEARLALTLTRVWRSAKRKRRP